MDIEAFQKNKRIRMSSKAPLPNNPIYLRSLGEQFTRHNLEKRTAHLCAGAAVGHLPRIRELLIRAFFGVNVEWEPWVQLVIKCFMLWTPMSSATVKVTASAPHKETREGIFRISDREAQLWTMEVVASLIASF